MYVDPLTHDIRDYDPCEPRGCYICHADYDDDDFLIVATFYGPEDICGDCHDERQRDAAADHAIEDRKAR